MCARGSSTTGAGPTRGSPADFLVTYTCDLRPDGRAGGRARALRRGRRALVRAARHELDPRVQRREGGVPATRAALHADARLAVPRAPADRAVPRDRLRSRAPAGEGDFGLRGHRRALPERVPRAGDDAARDPLSRQDARLRPARVDGRRRASGLLPAPGRAGARCSTSRSATAAATTTCGRSWTSTRRSNAARGSFPSTTSCSDAVSTGRSPARTDPSCTLPRIAAIIYWE